MSLESLLKVLFSHKVTIYKNTGCSDAQCHFEELYSGSQEDIPESLLVSIVESINSDGRGLFDIVVSGV